MKGGEAASEGIVAQDCTSITPLRKGRLQRETVVMVKEEEYDQTRLKEDHKETYRNGHESLRLLDHHVERGAEVFDARATAGTVQHRTLLAKGSDSVAGNDLGRNAVREAVVRDRRKRRFEPLIADHGYFAQVTDGSICLEPPRRESAVLCSV